MAFSHRVQLINRILKSKIFLSFPIWTWCCSTSKQSWGHVKVKNSPNLSIVAYVPTPQFPRYCQYLIFTHAHNHVLRFPTNSYCFSTVELALKGLLLYLDLHTSRAPFFSRARSASDRFFVFSAAKANERAANYRNRKWEAKDFEKVYTRLCNNRQGRWSQVRPLAWGCAMPMSPNEDKTAVHGCHYQGDVIVRLRKVLAVPRSFYVCFTA